MFYVTVSLIIALFALDITLSILDYKERNKPIPKLVSDVYNKDEYQKWLDYTMENFKLKIYSKVLDTSILILMFIFSYFTKVSLVIEIITDNKILQTILFLGVYAIINYIASIGFSIYKTFNLEERYGFNTTTMKTFITDQLKSLILTIFLGSGLIYLLLYLYESFGNLAILYSWVIVMVIILTINILYTRLFIRLFNKLTPLPEGELYDKAMALAISLGYEIKTINVMDASKRSTRLNAFFTGFGKFKSIILYDTLLEKMSTDEIISVLAHEIGHSLHKDVLKNIITSTIQIGAYLAVLSFFLSSLPLASAFGFSEVNYGFAIILFGILMEPIGIVLNIPLSAVSRKAEYRADKCAADAGYKEPMINALKVLARANFANLTPHPLNVKLTYSHPTINQRLEALNNK